MITINLLPQEFRVEEKKQFNIPYLSAGLAAGTFFILLTGVFYVDYWISQSAFAKINHEWQFVKPQSLRLTALQQEVDSKLKPENVFLNKFVTADRPLTYILSWVSEFLPETIWVSEFKLQREGEGGKVFVHGLALPEKERSSIEFIEEYLHQLKKKMPDSNLSLTTTRQSIKDVEVTQFTAIFEWGILSEGVKR